MLVSCGDGCIGENGSARRTETQFEFLDGGFVQSPLTEITAADIPAFIGLQQEFVEVILGKTVDDIEAFANGILLHLFFASLRLFYLDIVSLGNELQRFPVGETLVFHHKAHRISCLAASKALVDSFGRRDVEGRGFFVVKGAKAYVVGAPFLQRDKIADHLFYTGGLHDAVYGLFGDHCVKIWNCMNRTQHALPMVQKSQQKVCLVGIFGKYSQAAGVLWVRNSSWKEGVVYICRA